MFHGVSKIKNGTVFLRHGVQQERHSKHTKCSESPPPSPCGSAVAYTEGGHAPMAPQKGARKKCSQ